MHNYFMPDLDVKARLIVQVYSSQVKRVISVNMNNDPKFNKIFII